MNKGLGEVTHGLKNHNQQGGNGKQCICREIARKVREMGNVVQSGRGYSSNLSMGTNKRTKSKQN